MEQRESKPKVEESLQPIGKMSAREIANWEAELIQDGINPRRIDYPRIDGKVVRYDRALNAVIETTESGVEYLLGLRDGELYRSPLVRSVAPRRMSYGRRLDWAKLFPFAIAIILGSVALAFGISASFVHLERLFGPSPGGWPAPFHDLVLVGVVALLDAFFTLAAGSVLLKRFDVFRDVRKGVKSASSGSGG